jgi:hypothetical protein
VESTSQYLGLLVAALFVYTWTTLSASSGTSIFAGKEPLGIPLEKWAKDYWQWWMAAPVDIKNDQCVIGSDPSGRNMSFLVNTYEYPDLKLNCKLSSSSYILVPLLVGECDITLKDQKNKLETTTDYWKCAKKTDSVFDTGRVFLDGNKILERVKEHDTNATLIKDILVRNTTKFTINIPESNHYEITKNNTGSHPAVVDGWYLVLNPLPVGQHTILYEIKHVPLECRNNPSLCLDVDFKPVNGKTQYTLDVQ